MLFLTRSPGACLLDGVVEAQAVDVSCADQGLHKPVVLRTHCGQFRHAEVVDLWEEGGQFAVIVLTDDFVYRMPSKM